MIAPNPGPPLRVWQQVRRLRVAEMVCNASLVDNVYFSTVAGPERLAVIRAELEFLLQKVSARQVAQRAESLTIEHGPIAWHLRHDGRLLEQITLRGGYASVRFDAAARPSRR
ncbi:hypothetical protein ACH4VR_36325 [Streptomyces sp. NPDC020883]|uniref:hypothetical protein n=1 Tax=Streptomyces sp. NPDC020883 TaxID=3365099 RepID=UPI0037BA3103